MIERCDHCLRIITPGDHVMHTLEREPRLIWHADCFKDAVKPFKAPLFGFGSRSAPAEPPSKA